MTDTTGVTLRSGWVRAKFRDRVRLMHLVLDPNSLSFRTAPNAAIKKRIRLSRIVRIRLSETCRLELKVKGGEMSLFIEPAEDCLAWVDAIMTTLKAGSNDENPSEMRDLHQFFSSVTEVLHTREAALQTDNDSLHATLRQQVVDLLAQLSLEEARILAMLLTTPPLTHAGFQRLSTAAGFLSAPLTASEELEEATVKVTIHTAMAAATVQKVVSVRFVDPEEEVVKRSESTRALKWKYSGMHFDAISFKVDKNVRLTAISVCTPTHPSTFAVIEDLKILNGITSHSPDHYCHASPVTLAYQNESTQKVQLRYPVHIEQEEFYTILMRVKGKNTYKCVNCKDSHVGETGVHWNFRSTMFVNPRLSNKSDVASGPIAEIYYRLST